MVAILRRQRDALPIPRALTVRCREQAGGSHRRLHQRRDKTASKNETVESATRHPGRSRNTCAHQTFLTLLRLSRAHSSTY